MNRLIIFLLTGSGQVVHSWHPCIVCTLYIIFNVRCALTIEESIYYHLKRMLRVWQLIALFAFKQRTTKEDLLTRLGSKVMERLFLKLYIIWYEVIVSNFFLKSFIRSFTPRLYFPKPSNAVIWRIKSPFVKFLMNTKKIIRKRSKRKRMFNTGIESPLLCPRSLMQIITEL